MCGIAGFSGRFDPRLLDRMNRVMAHRGPDDEGVYYNVKHDVGLSHRRLSIIDLSPQGHQPMWNRDRSVCIVYNGEIYNFKDLRFMLEKKGHDFHSTSDTEVLLHLYEDEGHSCLKRLNGIFSFAIWDQERQELFLARDGLGVKPLYYSQNNQGFLFASELKALLQVPNLDRSLNYEAIHYYLVYLWCPAPYTPLKAVSKLEPGSALLVKNGAIKKAWRFYDIPCGQAKLEGSEKEIANLLSKKIRESVQRQMISDVPVGAFLSGGLDSSAVVAFAREINPSQRFDCFTIGFENSGGEFEGFVDDLPYAEKVAKHLDVNLHTVIVRPDMMSRFEDMIYLLDEPQADPAPLNALYICKLARDRGIKVLLSGTGGDDIFSGYRRHYALQLEKYWSWLPSFAHDALRTISRRLPQYNALSRRIEKVFRHAGKNADERLIGYFTWIDEAVLKTIYSADLQNLLERTQAAEPLLKSLDNIPDEKNPLNRMLYLEGKHFLADHNLNYGDKTGMAVGVEVRVPLIDLDLVDFASSIPPHMKQKGKTGKYIFKKAMEPYLPADVIYRPKSGFGVPLRRWITRDLHEAVLDMTSEANLKRHGIFDPQAVKMLIDANMCGRIDASYTIFSIMCIEWWQRVFLDRN